MAPTTVAILAGIAANAVIVLGTMALWLGYRARRAQRADEREQRSAAIEARLVDLTRAVEAVAVEVERIGETQRYLALQPPGSPQRVESPAAAHRIITPH